MTIDRRHFERLQLTEQAVAVDAQGRELGRVFQASGGGMRIKMTSEVSKELAVGQQLQVTVVEPALHTRNVIDVVVRFKNADEVGVEFVTGKQVQ